MRPATAVLLTLLCALCGGCAAVSNPVYEGIPVNRLPPDYLASPKDETHTIPLTLLRREPMAVYTLGAGDVLGIYVEGLIGDKSQPVPVRLPETPNAQPATGFPIVVSEDGTLSLPQIKAPLQVKHKTVQEVRQMVINAYTKEKAVFQPGEERILVSLIKPRQIQVLVVRQDSNTVQFAPNLVGTNRRGTGQVVDLPANENDVLNALTRSGGLPGFDAMNEVVIQRGYNNIPGQGPGLLPPGCPVPAPPGPGTEFGGQVVRIPLRLREGEPPPFSARDITLQQGDIVFIEARDTEVFYTGGVLQSRQYLLPRDFDLTVVEAIALAGGPLLNGLLTQNNLSGAITTSGLGSPSPSHVSVLRRTKNRGQIVIEVDLNRALRDRRENILIQAGDVIIVQETVGEALTRYITSVWRFNLFSNFVNRRDFLFTSNANLP
jgi:protein involved in polysaccharide export with SLBB domain